MTTRWWLALRLKEFDIPYERWRTALDPSDPRCALDDADRAFLAESVHGKLEHSIAFLPNKDGSALKVYTVMTGETIIGMWHYVRAD
jgi:hypothetical protein